MKNLSNRKAIASSLAAGMLAVGGLIEACGGSNGGGAGTGSGNDGSANPPGTGDDGGSAVSTTPGSCANPTIPIVFAPMFSAYIPGSTAQSFEIPAGPGAGNTAR